MRRLGERREYGPYAGTLGKAVHADFHAWTLRVSGDGRFDVEDLSGKGHEEPLPAGPESHWFVGAGRGKPSGYDYPYEGLLDAINRRGQRGEQLKRLKGAWDRLTDWEPGGEVLRRVVYVDCMARPVTLDTSRGWKHRDKRFYKERVRAWEIIGVLVVAPDVLAAAQEAGAADGAALAWATERGLVG